MARKTRSQAHDYFPPFAGLKSFYAVGVTGSAVEAAARLSISASAVSHQLKALETELGVRLIENRKGRLFLTADGKQYFNQIKDPMSEIVRATDLVRSSPVRKRVTLTLTPSFAAEWFMHRLADLEDQHPDIEVSLLSTTRVVDLTRENVDLAIRRGTGHWPGFAADMLMREEIVPVVSPELLASLNCTSLGDLLKTARVMVNNNVENEWAGWTAERGLPTPSPEQGYRLETYELTVQAAREGLGIALARKPLINPDLESGALVQPFADDPAMRGSINTGYFLVRTNTPMNSATKRLHGWLLSQVN